MAEQNNGAGQTLTGHIESRKYRRERVDMPVELVWRDHSGQRRFDSARMTDYSPNGAAIDHDQPLAVLSNLILRAPDMRLVALAQIRFCAWRRTQYRLGIEFVEKASTQPADPAAEPDYHELLRAGLQGDIDQSRLDRLYRSLASRYHPDKGDSESSEIFLKIAQAYQILSASQPVQPETGITKPEQGFEWMEQLRTLKDKKTIVLGLLCHRRISDYRNATVSESELESLTGLTSNEVGFILWYLRQKGAVTLTGDGSDHAISAEGIDVLASAIA